MAKDVEIIVFCGVDFMAETAKVLNPDKTVIIPNAKAVCPMAKMLSMNVLMEAKKKYPDAPVVLYVNTLAEAKAEATVTCTSANADKIVEQLDTKQVIFGPDKNLAYFVQKRIPEVELIIVPEDGHCWVHRFFGAGVDAMKMKNSHPDAEVWAHPECEPEFQDRADYVLSTGGMVKRARETGSQTIIVGTEQGLVSRLQRENPEKLFLSAKDQAICYAMKRITLENLYFSMVNEAPYVDIPVKIAERARIAINRMLYKS
jgi:quinolinate synthase